MLTVVCPHYVFTVMWQLHQSRALMKRKRDGQVSICVKQLNFLMSQEWMCLCCAWWVCERVKCLTYVCRETTLRIQASCSVSPSVSPLSHHHFSWYSFFLFCRSASPSSLIHSEGPPEQSGKICSVCEGWKVTLGGWLRNKKMEKRERGKERESEAVRGGD